MTEMWRPSFARKFKAGSVDLQEAMIVYDEIFHNKVYDWWRPVGPGDVVLDLGSNLGFFSALSLDRGASKIYMVEANPNIMTTSLRNVAPYLINQPDPKVVPINAMIGEGSYPHGIMQTAEVDEDFSNIERLPLKTLCERYEIDYIDFLKVDIEGNEYDIFNEENYDFLTNNVGHISMEVHTRNNFGNGYTRFFEFRDLYLKNWRDEGLLRGMTDKTEEFIEGLWDEGVIYSADYHYFMVYKLERQ